MSLVAKAPAQRLSELWLKSGRAPDHIWLRAPEIGAVMVRGRIGGTGALFNLGEMTVTRCALQLNSGEVGHSYVHGRDKRKAEIAAQIDALMQTEAANELRATVLDPLARDMAAARERKAGKAAATKVEFFTLVRGEDE